MTWEKFEIGNFVELRQGLAINKSTQKYLSNEVTYLPLLRIGDMKDGNFNVFINDSVPEKFIAKESDIIYTRTGKVGLVFRKQYGVIHNNCFTVSSKDESILIQEFLYYVLQEKSFYEEALSRATGAAQPDLPHGAFSSIEIFLPPIDKQKNIVEILNAYNDLIENNQKQIKLLEEAAQRLYKEWFVDLRFPGYETTLIIDGVPEGWEKEFLINLVDVQYGYAFNGSLFNNNGNGMPIVRIRNIPEGITMDFTTEESSKEYIVHNGDILVGMDGEFHINYWGGKDAYLVQRTCCLRPKFNYMKGYLFQAIAEPIKYFEKTVVGATVAHLGKKHIDTIKIFKAPVELYRPFQIWYEKRQSLINQNRLLVEARDRLLPKLMNGELEV